MNKKLFGLIVALSLLVTIAFSQQENDHLENAFEIASIPYEFSGEWGDSSTEMDEIPTECVEEAHNSRWWKIDISQDVILSISTAGSDFDTVLSLWQGTEHPLKELACNDDATPQSEEEEILYSDLRIKVFENQSYYIQVASYENISSGYLQLGISTIEEATNNTLNTASDIQQVPFSYQYTFYGGGLDPQESSPSCLDSENTPANWWLLNVEKDETLVVTTNGSVADTWLSIWKGTEHPLEELYCFDDNGEGLNEKINMNVSQGEQYWIRVSTLDNATGDVSLKVYPVFPPENDDYEQAKVLTDFPATLDSFQEGATIQANEPTSFCLDAPSHSRWWKFVAPQDGTVRIVSNLFYSPIQLVLWEVYEENLEETGCSNEYIESAVQILTASVEAGKTYYLSVGGANAETDLTEIDVSFGIPPSNTGKYQAIDIDSIPYLGTSELMYVAENPSIVESSCAPNINTGVWWKYQPTEDVDVLFSLNNSEGGSVFSIYREDGEHLEELACKANWEAFNKLLVSLENDITYYIRIAGTDGGRNGTIELGMEEGELAKNITPDLANTLELPLARDLDLMFSSTQENMSISCIEQELSVLWWKFTLPTDGVVALVTNNSTIDPVLSVWNKKPGGMEELACNDDDIGVEAKVNFFGKAGVTFYVAIASYENLQGTIQILGEVFQPNPLSELENAQIISEVPYETQVTFGNVILEADASMPSCNETEQGSMWWKFTPKKSGNYLISTDGSTFDTVLSLWEGDSHPLTELDCNDDTIDVYSEIQFYAQAGKTYVIGVSGYDDATGSLSVTVTPKELPENDSYKSPTKIDKIPYHDEGSVWGEKEENEENISCSENEPKASSWWLLNANEAKNLLFTVQSSFDVAISVWKIVDGIPTAEIACVDNVDATGDENLLFKTHETTQYLIRVSTSGTRGGNLILEIQEFESIGNDDLWAATQIELLPFQTEQKMIGATFEAIEETSACSEGNDKNSLWWYYTPEEKINVTISTEGSDFDTIVGLWTGFSYLISEEKCNEDSDEGAEASLTTNLYPGITYYIRVSGYESVGGNLILNLAQSE